MSLSIFQVTETILKSCSPCEHLCAKTMAISSIRSVASTACFAIAGTAFAGGGFCWQETITGCHRIFDCDLGFTIFFSRMRRDVSAIARHEKTRREGRVSPIGTDLMCRY